MAALRYLWSNGHRPLVLAATYAVLSAVILSAAVIFAFCKTEGEQPAIKWMPAHPTVTNRIPGVAGPAIHAGDTLIVERTRCNTTGETLIVEITHYLHTLDQPQQVVPAPQEFVISSVAPGCVTGTSELQTPSDLPPGRWVFESITEWHDGMTKGSIVLTTEPFEVVQ